IQTRGESQVFMRRPGIAVNATMLAATIRIDARVKTDIGAVIVRQDGSGGIAEEQRTGSRVVWIEKCRMRNEEILFVPHSALYVPSFSADPPHTPLRVIAIRRQRVGVRPAACL